jgi:hypothetical protein
LTYIHDAGTLEGQIYIMTSFYSCFRSHYYEVQRKCEWKLRFNEIHQFLTLNYRRKKKFMRNNETSFDTSKDVYEQRDVCGSYSPGTGYRSAFASKEFCKGCLVTGGVGKSFCASTSVVQYYDLSGRNMALGSTRPLSEIVPGIYPRGKCGRCVGLTNLTFLIYGLSGNQ